MPSLNAAAFIGPALASIARQGRSDMRIFLVDGGSTDGTPAIAMESSVELALSLLTVQPGTTPGAARNGALAAAEGELVAFLDADDLWPAGKIERQLAFLDAHPEHGMVSGYVRYFDRADASGLQPATDAKITDIAHVHVGACLYRRETLDRLGGFDEELRFAEDVDLLMRLRESGRGFSILRSVELYYRKHRGAMTAQEDPRQASDFRRAALKSLQRRRAAGTVGKPLPDLAAHIVP